MNLHPSEHYHYECTDAGEKWVYARYSTWLRGIKPEVTTTYTVRGRSEYEPGSLYLEDDDARTVDKSPPPDIVYGEWEYDGTITYKVSRRSTETETRHVWYFKPYPVTWLAICDICGKTGGETETLPSQNTNPIWSRFGLSKAELLAVTDVITGFDHVCSNCLYRTEMQHRVALYKGHVYVEGLLNISKRDETYRNKVCKQKRIPVEHRALIDRMVELREVRKASDDLVKLMRELKKKSKENNNGIK